MKKIVFEGKLTDYNDRSPEISGKSYLMEITIESGAKIYVLPSPVYTEIGSDLRSPMKASWEEWGLAIGRYMSGTYVEWKGMKVVVSLDDPY